MPFGEYIVYVDESGNHGMASPDPTYPVFVLALCVFRKSTYVLQTVPAIQDFKFRHFGHDAVVLHEREIQKRIGSFSILTDPTLAENFLQELTEILAREEYNVIVAIIDKAKLGARPERHSDAYHLALKVCLEGLARFLEAAGDTRSAPTHIVFEARGRNEDRDLELEFRRVCAGANCLGVTLPFEIVFASKQANSSGLQIADLVALPIGMSHLRPLQPNRAYEVVQHKFCRSNEPEGELWGRCVISRD